MKQNVAEIIFSLMPLLEKKFMKPVVQYFKGEMTPIQIEVLMLLYQKKALTMTVLANEMLMPKQQMTPIVDKLVLKKFVQREYDLIDRRIIRISLTSAGLEFISLSKKVTLDMLNEKFACLAAQDLLDLKNTLTELYKIIDKIP